MNFFDSENKSQIITPILLLATALSISACGEGISFRRNDAPANLDAVYQQVRSINPAQLDRCRVASEPTSFSSSSTFSSNAGSNSGEETQNRGNDATTWSGALSRAENEVGSKLFGNDEGAASGSATTSNNRALESNANTQPAIQITDARILSRENINYAQIDINPNSLNTATLYTRGYVSLDMQVQRNNRIQNIRRDSVQVDLTYMLSNSYNGWQCNQVFIDTRFITETPTTRRINPGDRIGW